MRFVHLTILALSLAAVSGCQSYAQLEANDPAVGEEEVFAAGQPGDTEHLANLHHVLRHRAEYKPEVIAAALTSVAAIGDASSVAVVAALSDDPDEEIRWHVAAALKQLGGADAQAVLAGMAKGDASELVREEAAQ
jgi:HEAT repeat protein